MDDQWIEEFCDTCLYCIDKLCRRFPPTRVIGRWTGQYTLMIHTVRRTTFINKACAEWDTK